MKDSLRQFSNKQIMDEVKDRFEDSGWHKWNENTPRDVWILSRDNKGILSVVKYFEFRNMFKTHGTDEFRSDSEFQEWCRIPIHSDESHLYNNESKG
jgi:hypothetical protein